MAVLSIYIEDKKEKEELMKLLKEATALYTLIYGSNARVADIIREALRQYNQSLRIKLQTKQ